jgi:hypothetical protein
MVLGEILKVGDTVVINIPDENWEWGFRPVSKQSGTEADVVGFGEIPYTRVQNFGHEPGIYVNHSWVDVKVPGKKQFCISSCHIDLKDKAEEKQREKAYHKAGGYKNSHVRLRDLPETKFWEGDVVKLADDMRDVWPGVETFRIFSINYGDFGQMRNDGVTPMPEYNIEPNVKGRGGYVAVNESQLTLVERGNVWKHYHKEPLWFAGIEEEAGFFAMLGHTEEVRNPKSKLYNWTKDEVLAAIRDGIADSFSVDRGIFGTSKELHHRAVRFKDRDLGERVAQATLAGFGLPPRVKKNQAVGV